MSIGQEAEEARGDEKRGVQIRFKFVCYVAPLSSCNVSHEVGNRDRIGPFPLGTGTFLFPNEQKIPFSRLPATFGPKVTLEMGPTGSIEQPLW